MKFDLTEISSWLRIVVWRNTLEDYLWAIGILVVGFIIKRALSRLMSKWVFRIFRSGSEGVPLSEFLRLIRPPVEFLLVLLIVFIAFERLCDAFHRKFHIYNLKISSLKFNVGNCVCCL